MVNRRSTPRVVVDQSCTLSVSGREVPARLVDLSEEGALFRLGNAGQNTVSNDDLGMNASFLLAQFSPTRQYTGEMIRLFIRDESRFVALRFWKKFKEVPAS